MAKFSSVVPVSMFVRPCEIFPFPRCRSPLDSPSNSSLPSFPHSSVFSLLLSLQVFLVSPQSDSKGNRWRAPTFPIDSHGFPGHGQCLGTAGNEHAAHDSRCSCQQDSEHGDPPLCIQKPGLQQQHFLPWYGNPGKRGSQIT